MSLFLIHFTKSRGGIFLIALAAAARFSSMSRFSGFEVGLTALVFSATGGCGDLIGENEIDKPAGDVNFCKCNF